MGARINSRYRMLYYFGLTFFAAAVVLGIWVAFKYAAVSPQDLANSIKYPLTHPIEEAVKVPNFLFGAMVGGVFSFFGVVCFGLSEILQRGYVRDIESSLAHEDAAGCAQ